jgi:hypothetical protein
MKKNKTNAIKAEYGGQIYDSKKEARYAIYLDTLKNAVDVKEKVLRWERQVRYYMYVNDNHVFDYTLDFKVWYADGRIEHVDVKGQRNGCIWQMYRNKVKLLEALTGIKIKEV